MRLLLAGGGTGGHLFPAVALAQLLLEQEPGSAVLFVGTKRGLEQRLLPKLGLPLATVDMVGMVGRGWRGKLEVVPKLTKSIGQAGKIIAKFRPDLVIGVGGYASVPVLLAAKLAKIPYLIHEQNVVPGLSNKLLGRWAELVCLTYADQNGNFMAAKTQVTGNPLRQGMTSVSTEVPEPGKLLIFGGSRGAKAINQAVIEMLPELASWRKRPEIIHQTGDDDFQQVKQAYAAAGLTSAQVAPFINNMVNAYSQASLVVCRAGATSLAELTAAGKAAILIPFPYAAGDHQTANARVLAKSGAAIMLPQGELTGHRLATTVQQLWQDREKLQQMGKQGRKLGVTDAAAKILQAGRNIIGEPVIEGV